MVWAADKIAKLAKSNNDPFTVLDQVDCIIDRIKIRTADVDNDKLLSADVILSTKWPEPVWAIPDLAPVGLTILAGKAKVGKSWLTLQIAHAVACGGSVLDKIVNKRPVLYLALEDPPRRLADRMKKQHWVKGLDADFLTIGQFETSIGDLKNSGGERLASMIRNKTYGFVVIDTLSKAIFEDQNDVSAMTRALSPIHEIAHKTNASIFLVDHHHKMTGQNPDVIVDILGSTAKGAVSDTAWGLYRERGKAGGKLQLTGRDIEEQSIALEWSGQTYYWHYAGDANQIEVTEKRQEVLDALSDLGMSKVGDIARSLEMNRGSVYKRLNDLSSLGLVNRIKTGGRVFYQINDDRYGNH